jgi:hypothetical protein
LVGFLDGLKGWALARFLRDFLTTLDTGYRSFFWGYDAPKSRLHGRQHLFATPNQLTGDGGLPGF